MSSFKDRLGDTAGLIITRGPAWGEEQEGQEHMADVLIQKAQTAVAKASWAEGDHPRGADGKFGESGGEAAAPTAAGGLARIRAVMSDKSK